MVLFLHNLTYQHQDKILPQEDGPRTKATLMNIIVQFIQCAALGGEKVPEHFIPFLHYPSTHVVPQNSYFPGRS